MPFDHDVLANVEATLDALSSPTPEQAYDALLQYDSPMVALAAARRALAASGGGGSIPSGDGSPFGVVTPSTVGALYLDTLNGSLYIAAADSSDDWLALGGGAGRSAPGVTTVYTGNAFLVGFLGAVLQDIQAAAGSGNGLYWDASGGDAAQTLTAYTGVDAANATVVADAAGTFTAGPGGVKFPTVDPHIAGAWWDNAGTLTKSMG